MSMGPMKSLRTFSRTVEDCLRGVATPLGIELSRAIRKPSFLERSHLGETMVSRCKVGTAQAHYGVEDVQSGPLYLFSFTCHRRSEEELALAGR